MWSVSWCLCVPFVFVLWEDYRFCLVYSSSIVVSCELDPSLYSFNIYFYVINTTQLTVCDVSSFFLKTSDITNDDGVAKTKGIEIRDRHQIPKEIGHKWGRKDWLGWKNPLVGGALGSSHIGDAVQLGHRQQLIALWALPALKIISTTFWSPGSSGLCTKESFGTKSHDTTDFSFSFPSITIRKKSPTHQKKFICEMKLFRSKRVLSPYFLEHHTSKEHSLLHLWATYDTIESTVSDMQQFTARKIS